MAILTPVRHRFYNNDGTVASGGKVYIYEVGSTTPKDSYTTAGATALNTWPVILDSKGECDLWVVGTYKINVLQSNDTQVTGYPVDNCGAVSVPTTATEIANTPAGSIISTTVQAAINELDTEKATTVQLNLKADVGGSASQVFDVANGVAGTNAVNFSQSFGLGQTWQNVTASRALGVTYTNSTGKPIQLNVLCASGISGANFHITVDGVILTYQQAGSNLNAISISGIVVPSGSTYSATNDTGCTLSRWTELR